jgi:hypothetical protein
MTRKIALGIFLLAIIFFIMPWVNVSCAGNSLASASGFDMVRGVYNVPGEYITDVPESETMAILALVAAVVGLIFSFFAGGIGVVMRILSGLAGIAFMVALKIKLGNDFTNDMVNQMGYGAGAMIQLNYLAGYWLTLISFAVATVVSAFNKKISVKITDGPELPKQSSTPPVDQPPPAGSP